MHVGFVLGIMNGSWRRDACQLYASQIDTAPFLTYVRCVEMMNGWFDEVDGARTGIRQMLCLLRG